MNRLFFVYILIIVSTISLHSNPLRHMYRACRSFTHETAADIKAVLGIHTTSASSQFHTPLWVKKVVNNPIVISLSHHLTDPIINLRDESNFQLNMFFARTAFQKTIVGGLALYGAHTLLQPALLDSFFMTTTAAGLTLGTTFYRYAEKKLLIEGHQKTQKELAEAHKQRDAIIQELKDAENQRAQLAQELKKANKTIYNGFDATREAFITAEEQARKRHTQILATTAAQHQQVMDLLKNLPTQPLISSGKVVSDDNKDICLLCSAS